MTERSAPTVSSLNSDRSTEQLIAPPELPAKSVCARVNDDDVNDDVKDIDKASDDGRSRTRLLVLLGGAQAIAGALLAGAGALAVVKGAALARVGAGLWAGGAAVVAGVVGVLAGIGDCGAHHNAGCGVGGAVSAHLALSLVALAGAQAAAALAAAGLHRDAARPPPPANSFQDEMLAWWPVVSNACVVCAACAQGALSAAAAWAARAAAKRPPQLFTHNQFEPGKEPGDAGAAKPAPTLAVLDEAGARRLARRLRAQHASQHKEEWGSASSRSRLVARWLVTRPPGAGLPAGPARGPPMMLVPAGPQPHHHSTLGRGGCVMVPQPRYATLPPAPPHALPHPLTHPQLMHPSLYYPIHDNRIRRRRSPRGVVTAGGARRRGGRGERAGSQLTRSLERIHRRRRKEPKDAEVDLKRTYTGLDRAYAEQFIAVCDESRHASEHHDSLPSDTSHS